MDWERRFSRRAELMRRSSVRELLKLTSQPDIISFAGGLPDSTLFPLDEIQQATQTVLQKYPARSIQYGETEGMAELRDWIAQRASTARLEVRRENVLIVSGSQQALDLIGKVFLEEGDEVAVEDPTYLAMLSAWRPLGVAFRPQHTDDDGLCVDRIISQIGRRLKLIYLVPNFQNPTGTTLALNRRTALADWARSEDQVLIEDDPYGELRFEGSALPSLLELDAHSDVAGRLDTRVIQVGTFSKILAPGFRVGWVIAAAEVIDKLVQAKQAADLHTSTFCQALVVELVQRGVLHEHVPRLRAAYRAKRDALLKALEEGFPVGASWTRPAGGMFLFVRLPEGIDATAVLPGALARRVAFVPGEEFYCNEGARHTMRLNFSNPRLGKIVEGAHLLAEVVRATDVAARRPYRIQTDFISG